MCVTRSGDAGTHLLHRVSLLGDELQRSLEGSLDEPTNLAVDQLRRRLAVGFLRQRRRRPAGVKGQLTHRLAHSKLDHLQTQHSPADLSPLCALLKLKLIKCQIITDADGSTEVILSFFYFYLCVSGLRDLPEVVLSPGGDLLKENLLGHSTPEHHAHPVEQLLLAEEELLLGQVLRIPQTFPSGNDGHLGENIHVAFTNSATIGSDADGKCREPGSMTTFSRGSACSRNQPTTA